MAELIRLGAYRKGSDAKVDESIRLYPQIEEFLTQNKDEKTEHRGQLRPPRQDSRPHLWLICRR